MSRAITDLVSELQPLAQKLLEAAAANGFPVKLTQTLRTFEEQEALYAQGRTTPGAVVTHARGGESWHNYGRAFDVVFVLDNGQVDWDGPWRSLGSIGEGLGLVWRGSWATRPAARPGRRVPADLDHFEFHPGFARDPDLTRPIGPQMAAYAKLHSGESSPTES